MNKSLIAVALLALGLAACGDKPAPPAPTVAPAAAPAPAAVAAASADAAKDAADKATMAAKDAMAPKK